MKQIISFILLILSSISVVIGADLEYIELKLAVDSCDIVANELANCISEMAKKGKANIYAAVFYSDSYGKSYINLREISPEALAATDKTIYGIMREQNKIFAIIVATSSMDAFVDSLFCPLHRNISYKELIESHLYSRKFSDKRFYQVDGDDQLVCYWGNDIPFTVYLKYINHKLVIDKRNR